MSWVETTLILLGYLLFNLYLVRSQLESVGQPSEHGKLLTLARMGLSYASVLYTIGTFKNRSVGLVRSAFGWTQSAQAVAGGAGLSVVDCAFGWNFEQRYVLGLISPLIAVPTLLTGLQFW